MAPDPASNARLIGASLMAGALLAGCGAAPQRLDAFSAAAFFPAPTPAPAPQVSPPAVPAAVVAIPPPPERLVLEYADRAARLSVPELAQEIGRLGEPGNSPVRRMQLAVALGLTGVPSDAARAQGLLRSIIDNPAPDGNGLAPLARMLSAQYDEQRRAEEQIERQNQQLRDAQRRIDQLNSRLEAVRAVERGLPARRPQAANGDAGRPPTP